MLAIAYNIAYKEHICHTAYKCDSGSQRNSLEIQSRFVVCTYTPYVALYTYEIISITIIQHQRPDFQTTHILLQERNMRNVGASFVVVVTTCCCNTASHRVAPNTAAVRKLAHIQIKCKTSAYLKFGIFYTRTLSDLKLEFLRFI